jgi:hypothetical protein
MDRSKPMSPSTLATALFVATLSLSCAGVGEGVEPDAGGNMGGRGGSSSSGGGTPGTAGVIGSGGTTAAGGDTGERRSLFRGWHGDRQYNRHGWHRGKRRSRDRGWRRPRRWSRQFGGSRGGTRRRRGRHWHRRLVRWPRRYGRRGHGREHRDGRRRGSEWHRGASVAQEVLREYHATRSDPLDLHDVLGSDRSGE